MQKSSSASVRPLVLLLAFFLVAPRASAAPILDQTPNSAQPGGGGNTGCLGQYCYEVAQTFTVGVGGMLSWIDLYLTSYPGSDARVIAEVRRTAQGAPGTGLDSVLANVTLEKSSLPPDWGWTRLDFTPAHLFAQPGDVLAIVLRGGHYGFLLSGRIESYARGEFFDRWSTSGPWTSSSPFDVDLAFRTWMDPDARIPEPVASLLMLAGVVAVVARRRRRH